MSEPSAPENLIPPGKYRARALEGALAETAAGAPQVAVLIEVLEEGPWAGHQMTWYGYFSERARQRTIESLVTMGLENDDLEGLAGITKNEISVTVEHEADQQGRTRARASWINRLGGGIAIKAAMEPTKARAFAASMKGYVASIRAGAAATQAGAGASATPAGRPTPAAPPASPPPRPAGPPPPAPRATPRPPSPAPPPPAHVAVDDIPF